MAELVLQGLLTDSIVTQGFSILVEEPSWAPTVSEFKDYFDRDFSYGSGLDSVRDKDVRQALDMVFPVFNQALWSTEELDEPFLFAAAHFLVTRVQGAGGLGIKNGIDARGRGAVQSKSVAQVSVAYAISDVLKNDPTLNQFLSTNYGQQFLTLLTPRLVAPGFVMPGRSPWNI